MISEINNIFNKSFCLTQNEIEQYVSGTLNEKDKRRVELHLADCPMCSDEIDGFALLKDKNKLPLIIEELNNTTDEKIMASAVIPLQSVRKKSIAKRFISIAASLILLLGAGYIINFYMNSVDKDLAEAPSEKTILNEDIAHNQTAVKNNTENKADLNGTNNLNQKIIEDNKSSAKDENSEIDKTESENTEITNKENFAVSEIQNNETVTSKDETLSTTDGETEDIIVSSISEEKELTEKTNNLSQRVKENEPVLSENEQVSSENAKKGTNISFMTTRGGNMNNDRKLKKKQVVKYKSLRESALLSYSMKIYDEAVKDFENYLTYKPNDYEILYKSGISYYHLKKYDKAVSNFNKVLKEGINPYVDNAEWYKAKSLVSSGRNAEAKIILNKIIVKNGKYQNKALDLLNSLN